MRPQLKSVWTHATTFALIAAALTRAAVADPLGNEAQWSEVVGTRSQLRPVPPDTTILATPTRVDQIGRILIPVMLNGRGPYHFVVDTGASHSTIAPRTAQALGLQVDPALLIAVNGITGAEQRPAVSVAELAAGDLVSRDITLPVVPAPMLVDSDGILGLAGLTSERLLVDFKHNRVLITRRHARSAVAGFEKIQGTRIAGGLLMITARVGHVPADVVIDTGSERSLGNLALRDAVDAGPRPDDPTAQVALVYGATSVVSSGAMRIAPPISLGAARLDALPVVFNDFHIFEIWGLKSRPALLLGMDALGTLDALVVDFDQRELYVKARGSDTVGYRFDHFATRQTE
jgi:predicted aspartyl protease